MSEDPLNPLTLDTIPAMEVMPPPPEDAAPAVDVEDEAEAPEPKAGEVPWDALPRVLEAAVKGGSDTVDAPPEMCLAVARGILAGAVMDSLTLRTPEEKEAQGGGYFIIGAPSTVGKSSAVSYFRKGLDDYANARTPAPEDVEEAERMRKRIRKLEQAATDEGLKSASDLRKQADNLTLRPVVYRGGQGTAAGLEVHIMDNARAFAKGRGFAFDLNDEAGPALQSLLRDPGAKGAGMESNDIQRAALAFRQRATADTSLKTESRRYSGIMSILYLCTNAQVRNVVMDPKANEGGLIGRCNVYLLPEWGRRPYGSTVPNSTAARDAFAKAIRSILERRFKFAQCETLTLCEEGRRLFCEAVDRLREEGKALTGAQDLWHERAPEHLATIILGFHALECAARDDWGRRSPSLDIVRNAIRLLDYDATHRRRVVELGRTETDRTLQARAIAAFTALRPMRDKAGREWVRLRQFYSRLKLKPKEAAALVGEMGWRIEETTDSGGRKKTVVVKD